MAKLLPAAALAQALHDTLGLGTSVPGWAWVVLVVWAVIAPAAAVSDNFFAFFCILTPISVVRKPGIMSGNYLIIS